MVDGGHAPTIPSAVALMGFHQANITRHNAEVLRASVAQRSAGPAAAPPPSGVPVSAGVSDATRQPSSANQVQGRGESSSGPGSAGPRSAQAASVRVMTARAQAAAPVVSVGVEVHGSRALSAHAVTSSALGTASKLQGQESAPTVRTDFAALANSSVGGNGLPRPYGRFLATREGNGLAVWERLPPYEVQAQLRASQSGSGPPSPGRNISRINIEKGALLQRNLQHDVLEIPSAYAPGGRDLLLAWPEEFKGTDMFAWRRPASDAIGNPTVSYTEEAPTRIPPLGATFLVRVPDEMPSSVKVDDSRDFEKSFLHPLRGFTKGSVRGGRRLQEVKEARPPPGVPPLAKHLGPAPPVDS